MTQAFSSIAAVDAYAACALPLNAIGFTGMKHHLLIAADARPTLSACDVSGLLIAQCPAS